MPLFSTIRAIRAHSRDTANAYTANTGNLTARLGDVLARTWDLGFTAFGGPPVHFQIAHRRFVEGTHGRAPWIDERVVSLSRYISCLASWRQGPAWHLETD